MRTPPKVLIVFILTGSLILLILLLLNGEESTEEPKLESGEKKLSINKAAPPASTPVTKGPEKAPPTEALDQNARPIDPNGPRPLPTFAPAMPTTPPAMPTMSPDMPSEPPGMPLMVMPTDGTMPRPAVTSPKK